MPSSGLIGTGTTISHTSLPAALKALRIGLSGMGIETINADTLSSEDWSEFIGQTLPDTGELTVECEWIGSEPTLGGAAANLTIASAGIGTWVCSAWLVGFSGRIPYEDKVVGTVRFKLTGAPVHTPPA